MTATAQDLAGRFNVERQFNATAHADATTGSGWVDTRGWEKTLFVIVMGTIATTGASNLTVQYSPDASSVAGVLTGLVDLTNAAGVGVSGTGTILLDNGELPAGNPHVRLLCSIGTTSPAFTAVAIQLGPSYVDSATKTNANSETHPTLEIR